MISQKTENLIKKIGIIVMIFSLCITSALLINDYLNKTPADHCFNDLKNYQINQVAITDNDQSAINSGDDQRWMSIETNKINGISYNMQIEVKDNKTIVGLYAVNWLNGTGENTLVSEKVVDRNILETKQGIHIYSEINNWSE